MESFRLATLKQIAKSAGILVDKVKEKIDLEKSQSAQPAQPTQPVQKFNYSNANMNLTYPNTNIIWPGPSAIHADGSVNILFFFRGGSSNVMNQSQTNAIVVNADMGGAGGGPSAAVYGNANFINSCIQSILKQLQEKTKLENLHVGKLALVGFSGGFEPIHAIISQESQLIKKPDFVGVFDGMHHGTNQKVNEKDMEVWRKLAENAAKGQGQFVVSHTALDPVKYASSTTTSNWLINQLGMQRQPVSGEWHGIGKKPESIAQKGNFKVVQLYSDKSQEPNEGKQHLMARDSAPDYLPQWD